MLSRRTVPCHSSKQHRQSDTPHLEALAVQLSANLRPLRCENLRDVVHRSRLQSCLDERCSAPGTLRKTLHLCRTELLQLDRKVRAADAILGRVAQDKAQHRNDSLTQHRATQRSFLSSHQSKFPTSCDLGVAAIREHSSRPLDALLRMQHPRSSACESRRRFLTNSQQQTRDLLSADRVADLFTQRHEIAVACLINRTREKRRT